MLPPTMPVELALAVLPVIVELMIVTMAALPVVLVLRMAPPPIPDVSLTELAES